MRPRVGTAALIAVGIGLGGCELAEVTTAQPEEIVVAEVYFRLDPEGANGLALLHRTSGFGGMPVEGAVIRVRQPGAEWVAFEPDVPSSCSEPDLPAGFVPTCYMLDPEAAGPLVSPGRRLEVEIELPGGGVLHGATSVPGDFELRVPVPVVGGCTLPSDTVLPMTWTRSRGAWAYLPEAEVVGIQEALGRRGVTVRTDPVILQGLAISEADTTIAFPSEFGVFNRFSDDSELLLALQDGLPPLVNVLMVVSALDRNAVNWVRGGTFNPSGQIRIPSLFGDGTGVVAAVVNRTARIQVRDAGDGGSPCLP